MDRLSGGATLIMQTGLPSAKVINVAANNFAQVYFTPRWMTCLSTTVHKPLSLIVRAFISDVQVPVVTHQRARLGDDKASENIQGHAHIPKGLVPATMTLNSHPCSPWRGGPRGVVATTNTAGSLTLPPLRGEIIEIPDSDDSDNEDGAMPSTPSRPSSNMPNPAVRGFLRTRSAINKDITTPALCVDTASLADVAGDLKRYASPHPFVPQATPTPASTPFPTTSAIGAGSDFSSRQERPSSGSTPSTVSSITTSSFSPYGAPTTSYYTRFNPIIPPGPSSERWLAENGWQPRFANVLREVAEATSLGSWADVLAEKHSVDRESAEAMVKCLLEDFELQNLPPTY